MSAPVSVYTCPQCGRAVQFSHEQSTHIQCSCGTANFRTSDGLQKRAVLLLFDATDFIQPGTTGQWHGKAFRVTGRMRAWIEEFVFNYWTIVWEDNSIGYLGEGYGLFSIYEPQAIDSPTLANFVRGSKVGERRQFERLDYLLERKYHCHRWELEGEIWQPADVYSFDTFEWAVNEEQHLEVIQWTKERFSAFFVHYTSLSDLQLGNTRAAVNAPLTVKCLNCSTTNTVYAYPLTQSYACTKCGVYYGLTAGESFKRDDNRNKLDNTPDIPIGAAGNLDGYSYKVVGFIQKQEQNKYRSKWREYTLYNREAGFAFLSEFDGHWTFLQERGDAPVLPTDLNDPISVKNERFELFNRYNFSVVTAIGEFPYNAFNDESKAVKEFISPPEIWIQERDGREGIVWFWGHHLSKSDLKAAFGDGIAANLPWKTGVGAVEPKGYVSREKLLKVGVGTICMALLAHLLSSLTHTNRLLFDETYSFADSANTVTHVTPSFTLEKWSSNLEFKIMGEVDNSWMEVGVTLMDVSKNKEWSLEQGVEYYQGYEGGERWSEGSRSETAYLSSIPSGTYRLQLQGTREDKFIPGVMSAGPANFRVKVVYDTTNEINFWLALIPIVLWPVSWYILIYQNEVRRWSNSPFSPYDQHHD